MMLLLMLYVFTSTPEVALQDIKLLGSPDGVPNAGRVQVYHTNNQWRDVCHDGAYYYDKVWSITEAMVACRQLGYPGAALSRKGGYGNGDTTSGMDDYRCNGNESSLSDCYSETAGGCSRGNDAGVICTVPGYLGCYLDYNVGTLLPDAFSNDNTMTVERCIDFCNSRTNHKMRYAGVEYYSYCFCGKEGTDDKTWVRYRDDWCNTRCAGNANQICGGAYYSYYISIYDLTLGKCKDPSPTNGSTMEHVFSFGKWVTFTCDRNYELVGETPLQCILGSTPDECMWSGEPPICEYIPLPTTQPIPTTTPSTTSPVQRPTRNVPTTRSQRPSPTPSLTTGTPGSGSTAAAGPHDPQQDAVATIIGATLGSVLALLLMVLLIVLLMKKKRNNNKTRKPKPGNQNSASSATPTAFVGPYDLTIASIDSQHASSIDNNTPIYSNTDTTQETNSKKQPVYANTNPLDPSSEEVYHEVTETSTDEDYVTVYATVDNTSDSKLKYNHHNKPVSVVYAKAQKISHNEPNDLDEGSLYYARSDLSPVAAGSKQIPECNGDDEEGWEDNIAYTGFQGDGQKVHENGDEDTEGWENNDLYSTTSTNEEVIKVVEATDKNEEGWEENSLYGRSEEVGGGNDGDIGAANRDDKDVEGWEDNVLYATRSEEADGGVDVEDEGWEDNVIYAGSDDE